MTLLRTLPVAVLVLLGGCVAPPPEPDAGAFAPTYPELPPAPVPRGGSLYAAGGIDLFTDRRAGRVGDIVTIRLEEQTQSSKSAETSLSKETEQSIAEPNLFGNLLRGAADTLGIAHSLESETAFSGSGESDQSNSLSGTISVMIVARHPNGLLEVRGEKWLELNQGREFVRIVGFVRPEDIELDNSVSSVRIANARIGYGGTGSLAESNQIGWLARFFNGPLMPW